MSLHTHSLRTLPEAAAADKATMAGCVCVCAFSHSNFTLVYADLSVFYYVAMISHKSVICPVKIFLNSSQQVLKKRS